MIIARILLGYYSYVQGLPDQIRFVVPVQFKLFHTDAYSS